MLIFEKPAGFPNFWVVVPGQRTWCTATRGGTSSTALQYYSSCSILRAENKVKLARRLRTFLTPPLSLMTTNVERGVVATVPAPEKVAGKPVHRHLELRLSAPPSQRSRRWPVTHALSSV
jgi:hypothetical protein